MVRLELQKTSQLPWSAPPSTGPLDSTKQQIRILRCLPGAYSDRIICSLEYASLSNPDDRPKYETISYCWKDAGDRVDLTIDDAKVSLPRCSAASIRRMRLPTEPRWLWIDAVCIDRSDNNERSHQVALMGNIYGNTESNLIDLGDEHDMARRTIDAITDIQHLIQREAYLLVQTFE